MFLFSFSFSNVCFFLCCLYNCFFFSINRMLDNGIERYFAKLSIFKVCVTMETAK